MKDLMKDGLILLATAQEFMADVADKMTKWEKSQLVLEKSAFNSLNLSDEVMNLSKNGSILVGRLLECCQRLLKNPCAAEQKKISAVLEELLDTFNKISEDSAIINEISHRIEAETAAQREVEDAVKKSLTKVGESVNTATACTEFIMTEL